MHTVIDAFSCRFVFLGSSLVREVWTFVRDGQTTKAETMPPLQLKELRKFFVDVSPSRTPSLDRMIDRRDSQPPPMKQTLSLSGHMLSRAPRIFFRWRFPLTAAYEKQSLVHICLAILHKSVFGLHCNSLTPCRNEVLVALRRSPCLKHKRRRIRLLLHLVDSSERSHLPGTSGLRTANQCFPPFVK